MEYNSRLRSSDQRNGATQNLPDFAVNCADISSAGCSSAPQCLWEQEVFPAPQPNNDSLAAGDPPRSNLQLEGSVRYSGDWNLEQIWSKAS